MRVYWHPSVAKNSCKALVYDRTESGGNQTETERKREREREREREGGASPFDICLKGTNMAVVGLE